ncbi:aminoglycoside phosphotransferase family protein [Micromonospora sp. LOL_015]|uniref:aminoglycoside phosphotransferase family protein n=1 Tax=Micromonospora sp. LOL_015 TaxID=3345416 RepID=UPI003A84EB1D
MIMNLARRSAGGPPVARATPFAGRTMMADVAQVEVVVAHHERATLRVGEVFLKVDADQTRADVEVEAMARAPVPTPQVPWTPVFTHGDLQIAHVFVDGDEVTGMLDWSEAGRGDALFDLATLALGHRERLGDVLAGYYLAVGLRGAWCSRLRVGRLAGSRLTPD